MITELSLRLGPLGPSLKTQIKDQSLRLPPDETPERLEKRRKAITELYIGNVLMESERRKAEKRLFKQIVSAVELAIKMRGPVTAEAAREDQA